MLSVMAQDIGQARAAALLSDALATGSDAAILRLERLSGVMTHRPCGRKDVLRIYKRLDDEAAWSGESLILSGAMPSSVVTAVVGLPLGSVVEGTGLDDAIILEASTYTPGPGVPPAHNPAHTRLTIGDDTIGAEDLELGEFARITTPIRIAAARTHLFWHGQPKERLDMPVRDSLPDSLLLLLLMLAMIAMLPFLMLMTWSIEEGERRRQRRPPTMPATV